MSDKVAEVSATYLAEVAKNAVPVGYKQTEVGVIPESWNTPKFGEICTLINGRGFKPYEWSSEGLPIIRIQNLNGSEEFNHYQGYYDPKLFVQNGQLLFAWSGSRGTSFGPHIWFGGDALLNYHTWKLVVKDEGVDSGYFFHILKQLTKKIEDSAHGASALVHTQKGEMENFFVPLPSSKREQTAIANALSDVDALISELEKLIAKKQAIKTATMQQLLTGRTRLPQFALREDGTPKGTKPSELGEIPEDWEVVSFGNTLAIRHGKNQQAVEKANGTIPIFATGGQIGWADQYLWNKPSVLIGRKGTIDKPRYADQPFWTVDTLFYSEIKDCAYPKFIFYKFCMIDWMQYNEASGVPSLNASTIERVLTSLPLKEEQTAIATILSDMDAEIQALEQRLGKTRQIKQGMMQELLTGKTRLIKGEANG